MTLKSYLRMLLAAVTLLFVTTGCNDDDDKVGPPPSYSFSVAVSDVAQTEATITVTPSDDQATYYYAAVKKAEFDTFESDAAYAQHILDNLQAIADKKVLSLSEYLATALVKGSTPQKITDLTAGTDYYAVALGMLTDGRFTSDLVKEAFKTDDAPEPALELSITMTPGYNGEGTDTQMSVNFKASGRPAVSGKYLLASTAAIDAIIAKGGSYDDIIDNEQNGYTFASDELVELNSEEGTVGENWVWGKLTPGTSYTAIAKVKDAEGNSVLKTAVESTAAAQGGGDGPELTLTMSAGDPDGNNLSSAVTCVIQSPTAVSGKGGLYLKANVDKALAEGATIEEYLASDTKASTFDGQYIELINGAGLPFYADGLTPSLAVTAIISVTDANGKTTVKSASATTASDGGETGDGPALTLTMTAGDPNGENRSTAITCNIKSSGVTTAKGGMWLKKTIDDALAAGNTIEDIIDNEKNGQSLDDYLSAINGDGLPFYSTGASPSTAYTAIVKVTNAAGKSTYKSVSGSTEAAGEAIAVEMKNLSHGRLIYYGQNYTGAETADYADWEVHLADATFDFATGGTGEYMFIELMTAKSVTTDITPGTYTVADARTLANLKAFTCWPGYVGQNGQGQSIMLATWYCNTVTKAQYPISGGTIKVSKSGSNYTLELDLQSSSKNATVKGTYTGALSFIDATKQSAPARAPWADAINAPKTLSSALQDVVEAKVSVLNSLSFEKPAATYEATIGNVENIEKPLGLKKHFIKK